MKYSGCEGGRREQVLSLIRAREVFKREEKFWIIIDKYQYSSGVSLKIEHSGKISQETQHKKVLSLLKVESVHRGLTLSESPPCEKCEAAHGIFIISDGPGGGNTTFLGHSPHHQDSHRTNN